MVKDRWPGAALREEVGEGFYEAVVLLVLLTLHGLVHVGVLFWSWLPPRDVWWLWRLWVPVVILGIAWRLLRPWGKTRRWLWMGVLLWMVCLVAFFWWKMFPSG